ncbi:MAG TPA: HIT domain-containing protein [Candidatus Babeliales bacterium]|nr:HIT domain-containing protein [Candidatus Babeliales bacterium]
MTDTSCVFCRIIRKEIPATVITETDSLIVLQDIAPKAPIHYLIIPKKHIKDIVAFEDQDLFLAAEMFMMVQSLAKKLSGSGAFRLIVNNGSDSGQTVFHHHVHFLSGKKMLDF